MEEQVLERNGREIRLYDCVERIIAECERHSVAIAIASRTEQPSWARELLERLAIRSRFDYEEIYPASKLRHFAALRESTGFSYESMLFFDDEMRNIREVSSLGVTSIFVADGMSSELFEQGLNMHRESSTDTPSA